MIHYQLRCSADHAFDGWFKDSAGFDSQAAAGLIACPDCGETRVQRALMAPAITRKRARTLDQSGATQPDAQPTEAPAPDASPDPAPTAPDMAAVIPDQMRAMLQKLRAEVERNCEHVGTRFAEEARAIHNGETKPRGIYGETTPEQAEALADDGIEIARIPWVPRADG